MEEIKLTDQERARREKLNRYKELGVNPFGQKFIVTDSASSLHEKCDALSDEELEKQNVVATITGRIISLRKMGKASFLTIKDRSGKMQGYVALDIIGEKDYAIFKLSDIGDIVGLEGNLMRTKTGELTVKVRKFTHLTKALKPLPEKFHGLVDVEERYRHRYVDLIMNDFAKDVAIKRTKIIRVLQRFLDNRGFIEVETSVLSPIAGGASARPFITHHNTLDKDFYLRIATELPLKKLLVGGLERVYEIGRLFRNEGMDTKHNPEFTTVEAYQAYADLRDMASLCEELFKTVAREIVGGEIVPYGDKQIDFSKPFRWVSMVELIKEETGVDFSKEMSLEEAVQLAKEHNVPLEKHWNSVGYIINAFFEEKCEQKLIQPTFVHTYPIEVTPLAKKSIDPRFTERFELFINATEFANAYSELNDPLDQRERFIKQLEAKNRGDEEANDLDRDFLNALEYGMPPAGGIGIGIDRMVMLMTNQQSIREVILFPCMRDEND